MSAGLPASGIGGALYLILIIWMLLRGLTKPGRSTNSASSQWPFIAKMIAMAIVMVAVVIGERMLIHGALELVVSYVPALSRFVKPPSVSFIVMATIPFVLLMLLMACVHALRFVVSVGKIEGACTGLPVRKQARANTLNILRNRNRR